MENKIIVKKGTNEITLDKTELVNNDIQFSKTTNGKKYAITLKHFSEKEIKAIKAYTKVYYAGQEKANEKQRIFKIINDKLKY